VGIEAWAPIQPLAPADLQVDFAEIDALHSEWLEIKNRADESTPALYQEFINRLDREWAIETGIIEGLYQLDRGVTATLVEKGLLSELIERNSTDRDPQELIVVLKDHVNAIEQVNSWIRQSRPLTKWFMQSLHQTLTKHQPTYRAIDQFWNEFQARLDHGELKKLPNNPTRSDGRLHHDCPPEQVDSELDNLVAWYGDRGSVDAHPLAVGAWLHHRFAQIHPFQDGNGRLARALLAWHLVKERFLPVVVTRDVRSRYIDALEQADDGELSALTELLIELEKTTILKALSVSEGFDSAAIDSVVDQIADKIEVRRTEETTQLRSANDAALDLRRSAATIIEALTDNVASRLSARIDLDISKIVQVGGQDEGNGHWYRSQVIQSALQTNHWANVHESRCFVRLSMTIPGDERAPRMVFVTSIHHVGRQPTGVMASTAFVELTYPSTSEYNQSESSQDRTGDTEFEVCSLEAFTFTWKDTVQDLMPRYSKWVEQCFGIALKKWGEALV
jgi:Fic family protein